MCVPFIIANPKVQLIFTHGGMMTIQEAIWHEKVILGMPIENEHDTNVQKAIDMGFAESINVNNFTSTEITIKIRMLIENPIYHINVRTASLHMKTIAPLPPKDMALYWIEQVISHNGLKHLSGQSRSVHFIQLYLIDIVAIFAFISLLYVMLLQYHLTKEWLERRAEKKLKIE
jgi:glucuronosyltransferase